MQNRPVQRLLFFVAQDFDEQLVQAVRDFMRDLVSSRNWSVEPPMFVYESTGGILTLGGCLIIYNALPGNDLPIDLDRQNLEEVKDLIYRLQEFSLERKIAFELELDGCRVGAVEDGFPDRSLRVGLLEEWERVLREREKG